MPARHFIINGRVQGVFFRAETQEKAKELNITGWVNNCEDGAVEVHAEGIKEKLDTLEKWLQEGPPAAHVEEVKTKTIEEKHYSTFEVIYAA